MNNNLNIIDRAAYYLTSQIRKYNPNAASEQILFYSLSLTINTLSSISVALLFSFFTGQLLNTIVSITAFLLLRYVSGGVHLSTSLRCCILSLFLFVLSSHVTFDFYYMGLILTIISSLILLVTAPNNIQNISRIPTSYYPLLKTISLVIVLSNLFFQSSVLSASFFIQAMLTTGSAKIVINILERRYEHWKLELQL